MKISKLLLLITIASFVATLFIYSSLPPTIPTHWNIRGQIDGYGSRNTVFLTGLLPLALYLMMVWLPKVDPKKESYDKHKKAYAITQAVVVIMMIAVHWTTILVTMGVKLRVNIIISALVGVMFLIMGNYMSQIRPNYFFGIRTPWTLADERVWTKTHRVGGYGFMLSGLLLMIAGITANTFAALLSAGFLIGYVIFVFAYSYVVFRKLNP